jgi:hypothetical protein
MRVGDRIAIKAAYVHKHNLPFDAKGQPVSVMAVKAIGTVTHNEQNGYRVDVDWTAVEPVREWFFYTYRSTIWRVLPDDWKAEALIRFAFENKHQDIEALSALALLARALRRRCRRKAALRLDNILSSGGRCAACLPIGPRCFDCRPARHCDARRRARLPE